MVVDHAWVDKVISMSDDFCLYDDYNWDWTLMHLSAEIIKPTTTRAWKVALPAMASSLNNTLKIACKSGLSPLQSGRAQR